MLKQLVPVFLRNPQIPWMKYLRRGHEMHVCVQKMHKAQHRQVLWVAVPGRVALGLCHRVLGAVTDLGVPSPLVSHPARFCLSALLLERLFPAFICPDYQHAEESCLVFT